MKIIPKLIFYSIGKSLYSTSRNNFYGMNWNNLYFCLHPPTLNADPLDVRGKVTCIEYILNYFVKSIASTPLEVSKGTLGKVDPPTFNLKRKQKIIGLGYEFN